MTSTDQSTPNGTQPKKLPTSGFHFRPDAARSSSSGSQPNATGAQPARNGTQLTTNASAPAASAESTEMLPSGPSHQGALRDTPLSSNMISLMDQFRGCGVNLELDVPTIAIIGNQSSGKSSVIEAICGVPLPRSTETCTRCPSEVRLIRKSGDWSCRVALRALKDAEGRPLTKIKEEPFGPTILHSAHVQERLYRAQKAVLCPSIPAAWFLDGDVEKEDAPKNLFSDTTICITITGPDCINLSFIDLPGIIANVNEGESPANIQLVQDMTTNAIKQENTLILLTVNCGDDIQNQSGFRLARDADPSGKRTIGVLTRPDVIQPREHDRWLKMLSGGPPKLHYGYYAVRNPGTEQLLEKITFAEARIQEAAFFNQEPWSEISTDKKRFGIKALAQELSAILQAFISEKMPAFEAQLESELETANEQLSLLPQTINDGEVVGFLAEMCQKFATALSQALSDDPNVTYSSGEEGIIRKMKRTAFDKFRDDVLRAPPLCGHDRHALLAQIDESNAYVYGQNGEKALKVSDKQKFCYSLPTLQRKLDGAKGFALAGSVPYKVKQDLFRQSLEHIPHLHLECFKRVKVLLNERMNALLQTTFGAYTHGGLLEFTQKTMRAIQTKCEERLMDHLDTTWAAQMHTLYTYNPQFETMKNDLFKEERLELSTPQQLFPPLNGHTTRAIPPAPRSATPSTVPSASPAEPVTPLPYEDALQVWAEAVSFWRLTAYNTIDSMVQATLHLYVDAIAKSAHQALVSELGIYKRDAEKKCAEYFREDEATRKHREMLLTRKTRLQEGVVALQGTFQ